MVTPIDWSIRFQCIKNPKKKDEYITVDYVFRNIKPWSGDVKEESEYLPRCFQGHNLEYTDLIMNGKVASKKMSCIHYRDYLSTEDKLKKRAWRCTEKV